MKIQRDTKISYIPFSCTTCCDFLAYFLTFFALPALHISHHKSLLCHTGDVGQGPNIRIAGLHGWWEIKGHPPICNANRGMSQGDSGAVRTRDPQLRRLLLYPTELRNQTASKAVTKVIQNIKSHKLLRQNPLLRRPAPGVRADKFQKKSVSATFTSSSTQSRAVAQSYPCERA